MRFDNANSLVNEGANVFSSQAPAQPAGTTSSLESGAVERSNVKPVFEMTRLMEVSRNYQSVANLIGQMDQLKRSSLSRLADTASS